MRLLLYAVTLLLGFGGPAGARTWLVGPGEALQTPSAAARVARDGDTVEIEPKPGGYYNCAVWRQNHLTIFGLGAGSVITDTTCQGKGLFVISGREVTIRNLTFARARVRDNNGAGIRAQGGSLRIEHSRFINNEVGLLADGSPGATISIEDSAFSADGKCRIACTDAVSVGAVAVLRITNSTFEDAKGRDLIRSEAARTELIGNRIADGAAGVQGYLVELPSGGSLLMRGNTLLWESHHRANGTAVIVAAGYGARPVPELSFIGNTVEDRSGISLSFVRNWTGTRGHFADNHVLKPMQPLTTRGYYLFLAKSYARHGLALSHHWGHAVAHRVGKSLVRTTGILFGESAAHHLLAVLRRF